MLFETSVNNTCIGDSCLDDSNNSGGSSKQTSCSPNEPHTHPSTDTVMMMMIKSPIHEHKQLVGHGNDEKPFQLQSNSEQNLSQSHSQSHYSAFNENNRKLFKKSCETSAGGGNNINNSFHSQFTTVLKSKKKMVAVQEITDTITKELDTFDTTEEFQYGPGIVSKLRYRYLTLTLRQNAQKQRSNLDSLRRTTSLNNLLDHDDDDEEEDDDEEDVVDEDDEVEEENHIEVAATKENKQQLHLLHQQQHHQHVQNNHQQQQQEKEIRATSVVHKYLKQNQSSVHFNSSVEQQQQQRTARQIKRGNDTLKRARSVEALLCDNNSRFNNNSNNNNHHHNSISSNSSIITNNNYSNNKQHIINNNRNSWNDSKSNAITIEDKIHNARERNLLSLDKIPKRLTSIIDDTERPPHDLVKQTLKMFEATANRRGGPNRKSNGDVAAKIATYKSIISQEKPIIIYPKPSSPKKSPPVLKLKIDSPISNMVKKFTPMTTEEPSSSPSPSPILENNPNSNTNLNLNSKPDIIPRKHSMATTTQQPLLFPTTTMSCESPVSELTRKINSLSIQTKATTTNSVSEQNSCESDVVLVENNKRSASLVVESSETTDGSSSSKRISQSALDNIAKAGTTQHFSFRSTPPTTTKQIGVIRPTIVTAEVLNDAATVSDDNNGYMNNLTPLKEKIPLTSREIQKNMINDKKREEATTASQSSSPAWLNAIKKGNNTNNVTGKNNNHGHGDNNSMVFNFKDRKEVPDYIENDGLLFRKRRELPKVSFSYLFFCVFLKLFHRQ